MTTAHAPIDPVGAATLLAEWGFLAEPDLPDRPGPAYLLIALRERPTLRHYDPELVEYWATEEGRGVRRSITRDTTLPVEVPFSWGRIQVVDRLGVTNEYVTFGGHLSAALVDGAAIAVFSSEAPLLRRGGHSQVWDQGASSLAAFFGRLLLSVDIEPGFEARASVVDPLTRYAAFVEDLVTRYRRSQALRDQDPALWLVMSREAERLRRDHPDAWARRVDLARTT